MSSSTPPPSSAFETSFDNDISFKSLIESDSNDIVTTSSNRDKNNSITPLRSDRKDEGQEDQSAPEDLNLFITDLLEQMQLKFEKMGSSILNRIDDMGSRIDTLEKSIGDLMDQSGLSEPTYGSSGANIMKKNSNEKSDD